MFKGRGTACQVRVGILTEQKQKEKETETGTPWRRGILATWTDRYTVLKAKDATSKHLSARAERRPAHYHGADATNVTSPVCVQPA